MEAFLQDIRFGWRMLWKSRAFTAVAVLSLALGIGANTTIFTLVNAVFLHPVQVKDAATLVSIFVTDQKNKGGFANFLPTSWPNADDLRQRSQSFSGIYASQGAGITITRGTETIRSGAEMPTGNYFDVLGVTPFLGRTFTPNDDHEGATPVVVLSYALWSKNFAADPKVVNSEVILNGHAFTIIGVMPSSFTGTNALGGPAMWLPMSNHDLVLSGFAKDNFNERRFLNTFVIGRLKPGVTIQQADAELHTIGQQLEHDYPVPNKGRNFTTIPFLLATINPNIRGLFVRAGGLMMTVVGLVLLIACANIANLLLARATGRRREISVRLALGATRARLVTQLMTESLLLSLLGGALGLVVAYWSRSLLAKTQPPFVPINRLDLSFDWRVLLFTLAVSVLTGIIFGLAPSMQCSRPNLSRELTERGDAHAPGRGGRFNLRSAFVIAELALSLITLVGAGLFLFSLRNAQTADPGFDSDRLTIAALNLGAQGYDQTRATQFFRQAQDALASMPGAQAATIASSAPLFNGGFGRSVFPEGEDPASGRSGILVQVNDIGENYLRTMGIPLVKGQDFDSSVRENSQKVVIINESMAKRFWPNQDPIGKRFKFFGDQDFTQVVGVAKETKYNTIGEDPTDMAYLPLVQNFSPQVILFVRTSGDPAALVPTMRRQLLAIDSHLSIGNISGYADVLKQGLRPAAYGATLLTIFAGLALLLAAIGIYGVMAYSVAQRTHEIGIRMALGASSLQVMAMVLKQGGRLVLIGIVGGVVVAVALSRLVAGLLFGIQPTDPVTFVAVSALLGAVAMAASYLPARRATKVDPIIALRYE